jgi:CHAT domain-containing protein
MAGVHSVIMSLWPVEDESTRDWMEALYRYRFSPNGVSTPEAVRSASLEILQQRSETGQSTHPFFWGAFVASGDWH